MATTKNSGSKKRLDPRVRWVIALIVVMIVGMPVLALRSYIAHVTDRNISNRDTSWDDERAVFIDGHLMLFPQETLRQVMTDWVKSKKESTLAFELSDRSFVPNSATPSQTTEARALQIAQVTKANPALMVHFLLPTVASPVGHQLNEQRVERFRDELVGEGVSASHMTTGDETADQPTAKSPHIAVALAK